MAFLTSPCRYLINESNSALPNSTPDSCLYTCWTIPTFSILVDDNILPYAPAENLKIIIKIPFLETHFQCVRNCYFNLYPESNHFLLFKLPQLLPDLLLPNILYMDYLSTFYLVFLHLYLPSKVYSQQRNESVPFITLVRSCYFFTQNHALLPQFHGSKTQSLYNGLQRPAWSEDSPTCLPAPSEIFWSQFLFICVCSSCFCSFNVSGTHTSESFSVVKMLFQTSHFLVSVLSLSIYSDLICSV